MDHREQDVKQKQAQELADLFEEMDGRRPRMFMAKIEEDGCDEERKLAATTFADTGWDVDVGSLLSPEDSAKVAADNDVHMVVIVSSKGHLAREVPKLSQSLVSLTRDDILIAVHGAKDDERERLFGYGVLAVFGAEAAWTDASLTLLRLLICVAREEEPEGDLLPY